MLQKLKLFVFLLSSTLLSSCLRNDPLNQTFISYEPVDIMDGWVISSPADENMDAAALTSIYQDVYADGNLWSMRSLLIFRNGKLVAESYLKDNNDITTRHLIWSCTKQVLGVLVGIAVQDGLIEDINDPISKYLVPEILDHPDKKDITIEDLITMRSGIGFSNEGLGGHTDLLLRQIPDESVPFILSIEKNGETGVTYNYNDGNPHLISAIIQRQSGKPLDQWADEVFFSKIGFTNYHWDRYKDGITFGAFGISTTPRELAKIAQCVLNKGTWNGVQLVDSTWIANMSTPQVRRKDEFYLGYYWVIDPSRNLYFMDGHGGQYAFVVPGKNIIIVMTAFPNTQDEYQITPDEALPIVDRILDAAN